MTASANDVNVRRTKFLLWTAAWLLGAAGAAAIGWGVLAPYDVGVAPAPAGGGTSRRGPAPATRPSLPPLEEFEAAWAVNLRRPLRDAPAALSPALAGATRQTAPPAPPPSFKLAGTVVEPGRSVALLQTTEGRVELKSVGERMGAAEILEIAIDRVVIRHNGQPHTLKLDKPRKG